MMVDRSQLVTRARYLKALRDLSRQPNLRQRRAMEARKRWAMVRGATLALLAGYLLGLAVMP